jgi:hypothetical protein
MRAFTVCWIGLALTFAGCCSNQESPTSAKSSPRNGADCDCCAPPSRSALAESSEEAAAVALKTIKFDAFQKEVKAQQGKVVCAYLWSSASAPSKKNLPLLIDLQHKFAKDGLVCVTVSNDPAKTSGDALKHLELAKCDLANYRQDDNDASDGWTNCFGCCGFPVLIVYGRDGKQAATFEVTELPFEPATIEKAVTKLLQAK